MKKKIKRILILLAVAALMFFFYQYFLTGKSSYRNINLVPADAAIIFETNSLFKAWNEIVHSEAWEELQGMDYFSSLNEDISSLDSMLSDNGFLFKILGKRNITASIHPTRKGGFGYLYVVSIGKLSIFKSPEKYVKNMLGHDYELTYHQSEGQKIYELLDKSGGNMYFFSMIKDKLVLSENVGLLDHSIKESKRLALSTNMEFINVYKHTSGKGLFSFYINHAELAPFINNLTGSETINSSNNKMISDISFSAFEFDLKDGLMTLNGYANISDSSSSVMSKIMNTGKSTLKSSDVIPGRVASLLKISFSDIEKYYNDYYTDQLEKNNIEYAKEINKYEDKLGISIQENILSWLDDEIVVIQTQPSNLGHTNELAIVLKSKNRWLHEKNMDYIAGQIKRNTPIKIKSVGYKDFDIHYISFPGMLKLLFGNLIDKIEKPYYTIIDKYVIFGNHPQTLKNIIDDYEKENTLDNNDAFKEFQSEFSWRTNALVYVDVPVFFPNLKNMVGQKQWEDLEKNKDHILSFSKLGVQIENKEDLLHLSLKVQYEKEFQEYTPLKHSPYLSQFSQEGKAQQKVEKDWYEPKIIIDDLDAGKAEELYQNGQIKYTVKLKRGKKHGVFKYYYPNGNLKITGRYKNDEIKGTWKLYDEEGDLIKEMEF